MKHISAPLILISSLSVCGAWAADHIDSPAAMGEPSADISDLYAWMNTEATHLNLVLNVNPFVGGDAVFSDAVVYGLHVGSTSAYGEPQQVAHILCQFYSSSGIECWLGDEYVVGDPSDPKGIWSEDRKVAVFAGLRDDPFFMEFTGFTETVKTVISAAPNLTFDEHMCPMLDEATSNALVGQLQSGKDGAPASDTLAGTNVLSLVLQVDKTLLNQGGPLLSVWGSTHAAQ